MSYPRLETTTSTAFTTIPTGVVTSVDCQKQVRSWRLLRSLIELLIPSCNCTFVEDQDHAPQSHRTNQFFHPKPDSFFFSSSTAISSNNIVGTIFGYRRGKISFCIQTSPRSLTPILLLELAVPPNTLAREMQGGVLRIALEANANNMLHENMKMNPKGSDPHLMSMLLWTMYFNGRKAGYGIKRTPSNSDMEAMSTLSSVAVGAGVINDQLMYLRANFKRVCGSSDSESFHLIDPAGKIGQELSIFFFRSR